MMLKMLTSLLPGRSARDEDENQGPDPNLGGSRPVTQAEVKDLYRRPNSFTDLLPWTDYDPTTQVFLLEDQNSVGALFELTPASSEARTPEYMEDLRQQIQGALTDAVPEVDGSPWVLQVFVQDDPALGGVTDHIRAYARERSEDNPFRDAYLAEVDDHLHRISQEGGLFVDQQVTGGAWRGQKRRVRACLYRRSISGDLSPEETLNQVAAQWATSLEAVGVGVKRCKAQDLYEWLVPWFNPRPEVADGDPEKLLNVAPYPGDEDLPFGRDLAELFTYSMPVSDAEAGVWRFDGMPHAVLNVQSLRQAPKTGHFTAERQAGENIYALFDRAPEGTILSVTITIQPQDQVSNHIGQIHAASRGDNIESRLALEEVETAQEELARGNKLYPTQIAFYIRAEDDTQLVRRCNELASRLVANGLQIITREAELLPLDTYLRALPMAYDPALERVTRRSRYVYADHLAALLPLYGRTKGTDHAGFLFYNRGAEPLMFDPLHPSDRKKNAHALILGPTGAGKSALLTYLILQMVAVYRPRIFIIEAGNSFGLLGQYLDHRGVSVNQVSLNPKERVSLPPFAAATQLLDDPLVDRKIEEEDLDEDDEDNIEEGRDLLGEMQIAAKIMITGGDPREEAHMRRPDNTAIANGILRAAKNVRAAGREQVLTEDVVAGLHEVAKEEDSPERRKRVSEMAQSMEVFCHGFAGKVFNRAGERWPEADVTIVDMGIMAREGYEDQLTVAYVGLMNHINDLVEQHQHSERPTLVLTDEGHMITTNPLLAPYVVKITKMWRKLGAWFWIATQNLEDFPDASRKMLNMMEWWMCLVMPKEEIEQIARFKDLTSEQKSLLLGARKEPGKYVEGVVLADQVETLFRNVPPPIALALAMTEKHEKSERRKIMDELGCSEVEAAEEVARRIGGDAS